MPEIVEIDAITGEIVERDFTATERTQYEKDVAAANEQAATVEAQQAAAESARAKLKKLGLTDDEIAALLGG